VIRGFLRAVCHGGYIHRSAALLAQFHDTLRPLLRQIGMLDGFYNFLYRHDNSDASIDA